MTPEEVWRRKSDDDLIAASARLGEYTDAGRQAIEAELQRRRASGLQNESILMNDVAVVDSSVTEDVASKILVARLWRGDVSLARTYWLYGILANVVFRAAIAFAIGHVTLVLLLPLLFTYLAYCVFISVAIWRATGRYQGHRGWRDLARCVVALNWVAAFISLLGK